jgi:hypothetical protein
LGTLSIGTKQPLGAAIFGVVSKYVDVVRKKSRSYGFTLIGGELLFFPVEMNHFSFAVGDNRVLGNAVCFHFNPWYGFMLERKVTSRDYFTIFGGLEQSKDAEMIVRPPLRLIHSGMIATLKGTPALGAGAGEGKPSLHCAVDWHGSRE